MSEREHGLLVYAGLHDQTATYGRLSYSWRQAARRRRDDVCRTRSEKHDTASATTGVGRHRTFAPFPHIPRLQKLPSLTSAPAPVMVGLKSCNWVDLFGSVQFSAVHVL